MSKIHKSKLLDMPDYEIYAIGYNFFFQRYTNNKYKADFWLRPAYRQGSIGKILDQDISKKLLNLTTIKELHSEYNSYIFRLIETDYLKQRFYTPQPGDTVYYVPACKMSRAAVTNFKRTTKDKATFFVIPHLPHLYRSTNCYTFVHEGAKKIFLLEVPTKEPDEKVIGKSVKDCMNYLGDTDYNGNPTKLYTEEEINNFCNVVGFRDAVCTGINKFISCETKDEYVFDLMSGKMDKVIYENDFIKMTELDPITMEQFKSLKSMLSSNSYSMVATGMQTLSHLDYGNYPGMAKRLLYDTRKNWATKLLELDKASKFMFNFFKIRGLQGHIYSPYSSISKAEFQDVKQLMEEDLKERLQRVIKDFNDLADANVKAQITIEITSNK